MMMTPYRNEFGKRLCEALGLQGLSVTAIELRVAVDEVVSARVEFHPDVNDEKLIALLKEYELHEKEPCEPANSVTA